LFNQIAKNASLQYEKHQHRDFFLADAAEVFGLKNLHQFEDVNDGSF
jgi:hypothetical protein